MNVSSSFWSRSYSIVGDRVTLRLYFGEVKVSDFGRLFEKAVAEFEKIGVPHDSVFLTSNRAGINFCNYLRMEPAAAESLARKLDELRWKASSN